MRTIVALAVVVPLGLAGCSAKKDDPGGQTAAPQATSQSSATPTTATTTTSSVSATLADCQLLDATAFSQLMAMGAALGRDKNDAPLRANVAATYSDMAKRLSQIAVQASASLRPAVSEWASATAAVAQYIAGNKPRPGLVIDYGPTEAPWEAAREATEAICGHPLPDTK